MGELERWVREARKMVKKWREMDKVFYQLAFIATGNGPGAVEAIRKLREAVEKGFLTEEQMKKILRDVERWRKYRFKWERIYDLKPEGEEVVEEMGDGW